MSASGRREPAAPDDIRRFRAALASAPVRQGRFERLLRLLIRGWCRLADWHIEVAVNEPLPKQDGVPGSGCVVAVAPHRAWLEPFLLVAAWPPDAARLVWLADGRTVTRSWWRRRLLPRLGVIPISARSGGPRTYASLAAEACAAGHAVAVFPEVGPPSSPGRSRRISPGFAYLALSAAAPVVPVVIGGTHHIVRGSSFSVDLETAIEPAGPPLADPFTTAGRSETRRLTERLEREVAERLPARDREADRRAPARDRWTWLATLFG